MERKMPEDRMLVWFDYEHMPKEMHPTMRSFKSLAYSIVRELGPGPERTVALRKLLESLNAVERAFVESGLVQLKPVE